MNSYYYDLHVHSCLSPCASNDMTPYNVAGMASLKNLDVVALTDHNSCKNCPAFFKSCEKYGIIPIAGMELTTAEDIHLIILFDKLINSLNFEHSVIDKNRVLIKNRTDIFGEQILYDANDNIIGYEDNLLPVATKLTIENAFDIAKKFDAVVYPAHIDRISNGIITTLGTFPDTPPFKCAEINDVSKIALLKEKYPSLRNKKIITSSDSHNLDEINEAENCINIDVIEKSDNSSPVKQIFKNLCE